MRPVFPILIACGLVSVAHAAPATESPSAPARIQVQIIRVTADRDIFNLAFPMPSRENGVENALRVVEQNAASAGVKLVITRFPPVTTTAGHSAITPIGRETPDTPSSARHHQPVFQNQVSAIPSINENGEVYVTCHVIVTVPDADYGKIVNELPTEQSEGTSSLLLHNGDTQLLTAVWLRGQPHYLFYATVTVVPPAKP